MAVSTYNAGASRSYNDGTKQGSWPNPAAIDVWASDTGLGQGRYVREVWIDYEISGDSINLYDGPFYGTMGAFRRQVGVDGSGNPVFANPSELAGKIIDSVRLRLTRYSDSPGSSSGVTTTVYATNLTSVPAAGAKSPDGQVVGSGTTSPAMTKGQTVWVTLPIAMAEAVIAGKCLCLYTGTGRVARFYGIEGSASQEPAIEITWHDPAPAPTTPTITSIGTVTTDEKTFDWSDSSDSAGYFTSAQMMYEMQISYNNGSSWGDGVTQDNSARITTAAGVSQQAANLRTKLALQPAQYYLNTQCKIRIRAKTPNYGGTPYYSAWATSAAFTIDYRITPGAPLSLMPSKADPYEGEAITIRVDRPSPGMYNTHKQDGTVMPMTYVVELEDGTQLGLPLSNTVAENYAVINYTVGDLTAENVKANRVTTIRAKTTDGAGQVSPYKAGVVFTIRRWRAPTVIVTRVTRLANSAVVRIRVLDTGFGASQLGSQIGSYVEASLGGAYGAVSLAGWDDLDNEFVLGDLDAGSSYNLSIRASNISPLTGGKGKTGAAFTLTILPYLPAFYAFFDDHAVDPQAVFGAYAQALAVGNDPDVPVNKGCVTVQHDLDVGGKVRRGGADLWGDDNCVVSGTPTDRVYKFNNGLMIITKILRVASIPITNTWGNIFNLATVLNPGNFAVPFVEDPIVDFTYKTCDGNYSAWVVGQGGATLTGWGTFNLARGTAITIANAVIHCKAIGRWK